MENEALTSSIDSMRNKWNLSGPRVEDLPISHGEVRCVGCHQPINGRVFSFYDSFGPQTPLCWACYDHANYCLATNYWEGGDDEDQEEDDE